MTNIISYIVTKSLHLNYLQHKWWTYKSYTQKREITIIIKPIAHLVPSLSSRSLCT